MAQGIRLTRGQAAEQVRALSETLSDHLMVLEEATFVEIGKIYDDNVEAIRSLVKQEWNNDSMSLLTNIPAALDMMLLRAVAKALDMIGGLARESANLSYTSIIKELLICQQSLPAKYRGTVERIEFPVGVAEQAVDTASQSILGWRRMLAADLNSAERTTDLETATDQVLAAWSGTVAHVRAVARAVSIGVANVVRESAMLQFNALAATVP